MSFPARKIRSLGTRTTLQPSVRDFSEQVIGNYIEDDDLSIGNIRRAQSESSFHPKDALAKSSGFRHSMVTYSTLEASTMHHIPATFNSPRSVSPDEVHRRHVIKSARLRSRLSGNRLVKRQESRASVMSANSWLSDTESRPGSSYPSGSGFSGLSPRTPERPLSAYIGQQSPRERPSTTHGRYFAMSNGLCRTSPGHYALNYRNRNSAWVGPGMVISKMTLQPKDNVWTGNM